MAVYLVADFFSKKVVTTSGVFRTSARFSYISSTASTQLCPTQPAVATDDDAFGMEKP